MGVNRSACGANRSVCCFVIFLFGLREANATRGIHWARLYRQFASLQLVFTERRRVKKLITVIDPQAYASLAGCQISSYCCNVATVDIVSGFFSDFAPD